MSVILKDRLGAVKHIPLSVGSHSPPPDGEVPCAFCAAEKWSWVRGLPWSVHPGDSSPVFWSFVRAFQDKTDQDGRDKVDAWMVANADRLASTADDEHEQKRGFMAVDWATRVAFPLWLDLAGATDAASSLRARGEVTDRAEAEAISGVIVEIRKDLPDWYDLCQNLSRRVREAVREYAEENPQAAEAARAAEATWVAWVAEAAWAAWAAWAARAAEVAEVAFRRQVREAIEAKIIEAWGERYKPTTTSIKASAIELLERMCCDNVSGSGVKAA